MLVCNSIIAWSDEMGGIWKYIDANRVAIELATFPGRS